MIQVHFQGSRRAACLQRINPRPPGLGVQRDCGEMDPEAVGATPKRNLSVSSRAKT